MGNFSAHNLRRATATEIGHHSYEQLGFDAIEKDSTLVALSEYVVWYADKYRDGGTPAANNVYLNINDLDAETYTKNGELPHWIGVHNTHPAEVVPIQLWTLSGDALIKENLSGRFDPDDAIYMELGAGDIIHSKFKAIAVLRSTSGSYNLRLIRGV